MKGVKPDSVNLSQDKGLKVEGVDKSCPEPDIGYPAIEITPEKTKGYQ